MAGQCKIRTQHQQEALHQRDPLLHQFNQGSLPRTPWREMGLSHMLQVSTLRFIKWFQFQHEIPTFSGVIKTNLSRNSPCTEQVEGTTTIPVLQTFAIGSDILQYSATQMAFSATAHRLKTRGVKMSLRYQPICREVCSLRCARWTRMRARTRRIIVQNC